MVDTTGWTQETIDRQRRLAESQAAGNNMQFTGGGSDPYAGRLTNAPVSNAFTDSLGWNQPIQQQPANSPNSLGPVASNGQQNTAPAVAFGTPAYPATPSYPAQNLGLGSDPMQQTAAQSPTTAAPTGVPQQTQNPYAQQPQNPYLGYQAQAITNQVNDNWTRNLQPSIRSGAMAAGGYGGSRQGVVEANGLKDLNQGLGNSLSNLYGNAWQQQQSNNLQQQSLNNSYDLGLRSNDLGYANLDAGIYNSNFSNQLAAANFGLGVNNTLNQQTQNGINAGTQIQNTPLDYQKYFTNSANGVGSGYSTGTSSQTNPGNPYMSAIGGAMMGNQLQYPTVK